MWDCQEFEILDEFKYVFMILFSFHYLQVSGENPPRAIDSFETANLRKYVLDNILKAGYKKPTPIQKHAIPIIMGGRDLMGCAQTGSGKTVSKLDDF